MDDKNKTYPDIKVSVLFDFLTKIPDIKVSVLLDFLTKIMDVLWDGANEDIGQYVREVFEGRSIDRIQWIDIQTDIPFCSGFYLVWIDHLHDERGHFSRLWWSDVKQDWDVTLNHLHQITHWASVQSPIRTVNDGS